MLFWLIQLETPGGFSDQTKYNNYKICNWDLETFKKRKEQKHIGYVTLSEKNGCYVGL